MKKEIKVYGRTNAGEVITETFTSYAGINKWAEKFGLQIFKVIDKVVKK